MAQVHQPLEGGGPTVGSFMAYLLRRGVAYWNDLPFHQGLMDGAPRIACTHAQSKIQNRRHGGKCECTLIMIGEKKKYKGKIDNFERDEHNNGLQRNDKEGDEGVLKCDGDQNLAYTPI